MMTNHKYQIEIETDSIEAVKTTLELVCKIIEVKKKNETRTSQQNKAIWLWLTQLAESLNENNFDMRTIIREDVDIAWSKDSLMEYVFRPLMKARFGKESTTKLLKTQEIDEIIDIITKIISERTKGFVEIPIFPSDEFYR